LTLLEALALASLWALGIDDVTTPYQALAYAFSTMPTGGFTTVPGSAQALSAPAQWILVLFMAGAGAHFALLLRAILPPPPRALERDEELRLYGAVLLVAAATVTAMLWGFGIARGEEAIRTGAFQAVSMVTTTGFASANFALWPPLLLVSLFALMFVGGSAGSTGSS